MNTNDPLEQATKKNPLEVARALEVATLITMNQAEKQFNEAVEFFKVSITAHQEAVATVAILELNESAKWHDALRPKKGGAN
jgi:hypothetical protein